MKKSRYVLVTLVLGAAGCSWSLRDHPVLGRLLPPRRVYDEAVVAGPVLNGPAGCCGEPVVVESPPYQEAPPPRPLPRADTAKPMPYVPDNKPESK
ncbi:MAG: hypothetical protein C4297_06655 [Gemmataceae bacterium]